MNKDWDFNDESLLDDPKAAAVIDEIHDACAEIGEIIKERDKLSTDEVYEKIYDTVAEIYDYLLVQKEPSFDNKDWLFGIYDLLCSARHMLIPEKIYFTLKVEEE